MPTLLAFIPHPDDESYSFGGTLPLAARAGWDVHVHCATSGEKGKRHDSGGTAIEAVRRAREAELGASCRAIGTAPPVCWRLPDGRLRDQAPPIDRVRAAIEGLRPALVLTLGADGAYGHPDHTALHRWVAEAWAAVRDAPPLLFPVFPKGLFLPQWEKCRHMLGEPPNPAADELGGNRWHYEVPIVSVREQKLASIGAHRSQLPGGDPEALFPPGIVAGLLDVEWFVDASGRKSPSVATLLASLA